MAKKKKDRVRATQAGDAPARVAKPKIRIEEKPTRPAAARPLTFGPETYKWMGIGFALVFLGLFLMAGSRGDNFAEFAVDDIYSPIKITIAPAVILIGLGVVVYAVLKK